MPFKINVNGTIIEADTAKEALALAKELAGKLPVPTQTTQVPRDAASASPIRWEPGLFVPDQSPRPVVGQAALTAAILGTIRESGSGGAPAGALMPIVGGNHVLGLGAKLRPVKRFLFDLGFEHVDEVYRTERVDNKAVWVQGPKLEEALQKATNLVSRGS